MSERSGEEEATREEKSGEEIDGVRDES